MSKSVYAKMVKVASQLTVADLKEQIVKLNPVIAVDSAVVEALLDALKDKVSENDFVEFCDCL